MTTPRRKLLAWSTAGVLIVAAGLTAWHRSANDREDTVVTPLPPVARSEFLNAAPGVGFVGVQTCAECHPDQQASWLETAHSRALGDVRPEHEPDDGRFEDTARGRGYRIFRRDGQLWHAEYLLGGDGQALLTAEFPMRYVIGSGRFSRKRAIDELERNHAAASQDLDAVLWTLAQVSNVDPVPFYRAVIEHNPHRAARGVACFYLAGYLLRSSHGESEAERRDEAVALYRRVERAYVDVPHRGSTLGQLAAARAFDLNREHPGGPGGPPVQVFFPGFTVRELPVRLPNINNVRYRDDGKLLALGYDGVIYLLSDGDGDGLEDRAGPYWDGGGLRAPIGMALTPPGYEAGTGVSVASKGKVSLLLDTDGDDKADQERIVASGWTEIPYVVDAMGVVLDERGRIYFGVGCADYKNPYLIDENTGIARYSRASERGTILRVSSDFKTRDIVCTGLRFPAGMAFNRHGDLFCTDQEGDTWLPGGNPLDELLHIVPGRHYGFPPRHDTYLADIIDEPSLYEYSPKHQATCGLYFNEASDGRKHFGPPHWAGDALVAGYVRGKLYRTKLARTPSGYVAVNTIFASLGLLTVDMAVSPEGRMVVACHSGTPSWGSGPNGAGKLFKISYTNPTAPQPVAIWAAGPMEIGIAFDRPIGAALPAGFAEAVEIAYGDFVRAGDRFEVLKPAFREIDDQRNAPRSKLRVVDAELSKDRRTVTLRTLPHPARTWYAVRMPQFDRPGLSTGGSIELDYTLTGVEAAWEPAESQAGAPAWTGWLPCLDLRAATALLTGSAEHERLAQLLRKRGRLTLRTAVATDPGTMTIQIDAGAPFEAKFGEDTVAAKPGRSTLRAHSADAAIPLVISLETGSQPNQVTPLSVSYCTGTDLRERALPGQRLLLPWVPAPLPALATPSGPLPELGGGDWHRGRAVFLKEGRCAQCHQVRGEGNATGLDLSDLIHRDARSVLRDIVEPSAAINPDYVTHVVALRSGRSLAGFLRPERTGRIRVTDTNGHATVVSTADVELIRAIGTSAMPAGLDEMLGPERMNDLLTFLLRPAPPPPPANDTARHPGSARTLPRLGT